MYVLVMHNRKPTAMLSTSDEDFISKNFNVYEHNWRFYEELLGEPALLGSTLAYCDGAGVYLPAFSLRTPYESYSPDEVIDLLSRSHSCFSSSGIRFFNVWGSFDDLRQCWTSPCGIDYALVEQSDYYDQFDTIFDVMEFDQAPTKSALKRLRHLHNAGVSTGIFKARSFSHEHLSIIERWSLAHDVTPVHMEFFYALKSYLAREGVYLCEARRNGALIGLSVIAVVSDTRLVAVSAFPLREPGTRAGDALFAATVEFARQRSARWIHEGYSATASLLRTKESWGCVSRGPRYREAFYACDEATASMIAEGKFLWRLRLQQDNEARQSARGQVPPPP